jgi:hypothetical protein
VILVNLVEEVVHEVVVKGHSNVVLLEEGLHKVAQFLAVEEARLVSVEFSEEFADLSAKTSRVVGVLG